MSELAITPVVHPRCRTRKSGQCERPLWLAEVARQCNVRKVVERDAQMLMTTLESANDRLIHVRVRGATALSPSGFEAVTIQAYAAISEELAAAPARHPVRFWNYIPDIHRDCGGGVDRYMTFNAGRYEAFRRWFGPENMHRLPTASGIGHDGPDLVIEALATDVEGIAVDNPRQIPPVRYSRRYGVRPPCFARAMLVPGHAPRLLVGGTASVVGEISLHHRDLRGQIDETMKNLQVLLGSSGLATPHRFSELRVYHRRPGDAGTIEQAVRRSFGAGARIELTLAELCRRELLVEIEGVVVATGTE